MKETLLAIADQLHQARLRQAETKEAFLKASLHHSTVKAEAYSNYAKTETHYKATAFVATDLDVVKAHEQQDAAQIAHYKSWVECSQLYILLSIHRPLAISGCDQLGETASD